MGLVGHWSDFSHEEWFRFTVLNALSLNGDWKKLRVLYVRENPLTDFWKTVEKSFGILLLFFSWGKQMPSIYWSTF